MHVHHFNTYTDGGAATAASRLHRELNRLGVEGCLYFSPQFGTAEPGVLDGETNHSGSLVPIRWDASWRSRTSHFFHRQAFKSALQDRPSGLEFFTSPRGVASSHWPPKRSRQSNMTEPGVTLIEPDVIHLHWTSRLIDYQSFFSSIPRGKPIVWTLHDMNAFTGGCHFSAGCERFRIRCGHCPQLGKRGENDFSRQAFDLKKQTMDGLNLHVVAPSRWMFELASSSPILQTAKSFSHIPYGVSPDHFYPMDKQQARGMLGLDANAFVVSLGAMSIENRRKGTLEALRALTQLRDLPELQVLVFGSGKLPELPEGLPRIRSIGSICEQAQRIAAYSASDLFVLPSLEDNLPLTGLESLACGTPIIGFAVGGIPDYVRQDETGRLVVVGNSDELARQTRDLMANPKQIEAMSKSARELILREYTGEREAKAYMQLYAALCDFD